MKSPGLLRAHSGIASSAWTGGEPLQSPSSRGPTATPRKPPEELGEWLDETAIHQRTDCVFHSSYWPAKLLWLSRSHPEVFEPSERRISPGEYVHLKLFGKAWASTSVAAGTGLFDQNRELWDGEVLCALPAGEVQLSYISDEPARGLRGEWARRWPSLAAVPWLLQRCARQLSYWFSSKSAYS